MDQLSKAARSALMSRIPSRANQSTELACVNMRRTNRITGWRRGAAILGNHDFVFPQKRVVMCVDGWFWQGDSRCNKMPKLNTVLWRSAISRNRLGDRCVIAALRSMSYSVIRVWEHDLVKARRKRIVVQLKKLLRTR